MIRSLIAAALVALPGLASAQTAPDICSSGLSAVVSRPTQTTSACVVKPNQVLIETGYQSQTVDVAGGSYTYQSCPLAAIRIGTKLRGVELQVLPPSAIRSGGVPATSDAGAGLKWQIGATPAFAYGVQRHRDRADRERSRAEPQRPGQRRTPARTSGTSTSKARWARCSATARR